MKIWDIYDFLWRLQESIGDNCSVSMTASDGILSVTINWFEDDLQYKFSNSATFLEHMDVNTFITVVSREINTKYRVATVGEE